MTVVIKTGAGGTTGTVAGLQSAPDGYTLVLAGNSNGTINPALEKNLPYKWDQPTMVARGATNTLELIVKAGPTVLFETKHAPSVTNRLGTSHVWQMPLTTDVRGSAPMRAPPHSWIAAPNARLRPIPLRNARRWKGLASGNTFFESRPSTDPTKFTRRRSPA